MSERMSTRAPYVMSDEARVAEYFLELALSNVYDGLDAIPEVAGALAALRVEAGELPRDELPEIQEDE